MECGMREEQSEVSTPPELLCSVGKYFFFLHQQQSLVDSKLHQPHLIYLFLPATILYFSVICLL